MGGTALDPQRVTPVKSRRYRHFDAPLSRVERENFSVTPAQVASHDFWPLIGFEAEERRIDFDSEPFWEIEGKTRGIRYAAHLDSAIYTFYADAIGDLYQSRLASGGLDGAVLAYRAGVGSNINFAHDLFQEVKARGACQVVCLDISKFFDSIRHDNLKARLCELLGTVRLSTDWWKIFQRLTSYDFVERADVDNAVNRSHLPHRLCSPQQFRELVRPHIQRNTNPFGIPQGSPLSGMLANIYMLVVDESMLDYVCGLGGSYRRYSDDIAIVLPPHIDQEQAVQKLVDLLEVEGLTLNPKKTARTVFDASNVGLTQAGDHLQYLGFTFDGTKVLLRSSSLKRFFSGMKRSIRIAVRAAKKKGYPSDGIHRRALVGRFTHWGDNKNFVQYAYRASRIMDAPEIRRQLRNHVVIFRRAFAKYVARYYGPADTLV